MHCFKFGLVVIGSFAAFGTSVLASSVECSAVAVTTTMTNEVTVTKTTTEISQVVPSTYAATSTSVVTVTQTEITTHVVTSVKTSLMTASGTLPAFTETATITREVTVAAPNTTATGPYYYSVHSGTTVWVGHTPGPSVTFVKTLVTTAFIVPFTSNGHDHTEEPSTATVVVTAVVPAPSGTVPVAADTTCTDFPTLTVNGTMGISPTVRGNGTVSGSEAISTGNPLPTIMSTGVEASTTVVVATLNITSTTFHYLHLTSTRAPSYGFSIPTGTGSSVPLGTAATSLSQTYSFYNKTTVASSAPLGTAASSLRSSYAYSFSSLNGTAASTASFGATGSSIPVVTATSTLSQAYSFPMPNGTASTVPFATTGSSAPAVNSSSTVVPTFSFSALNSTASTAPYAATGSSVPLATSTSSTGQAYSFSMPNGTFSTVPFATTGSSSLVVTPTASTSQAYSFSALNGTASTIPFAATGSSTSVPSSTFSVAQGYEFSIQTSEASKAPSAASTSSTGQAYSFNQSTTASATPLAASTTLGAQNSTIRPPFYPLPSVVINEKRQVGAVVTATINGQVVSWTNSYDGQIATSTSAASPQAQSSQTDGALSYSFRYTGSPITATPFPTPSVTIVYPTTLMSMRSTTTISPSYNGSSTAAALQQTCTEPDSGIFTINFDDLPIFSEPPKVPHAAYYPPIPNPYEKLFWSQGWAYAPPPTDPYVPSSGAHLGAFVVDGNANVHSGNFTGTIPSDSDVNGMFGAGPRYENDAYWIDAFSASVGCSDFGGLTCEITVNGFEYDTQTKESRIRVQQTFHQAPCKSRKGCPLMEIVFEDDFRNLTALQIVARLPDSDPVTFYMDDVKLAWSNDSCAATQERGSTRV